MTALEIILIVTIYIVMASIVSFKQYAISRKIGVGAPDVLAFLAFIFWPIFLIVYIVRTTFFNDWV